MSAGKLPESYQGLVEVVGEEAADKLCRMYGGESLYIPKADTIEAVARRAKIISEYNGGNIKALAAKYGLTSRRIRQIVGDAAPPVDGQIDLFEDV